VEMLVTPIQEDGEFTGKRLRYRCGIRIGGIKYNPRFSSIRKYNLQIRICRHGKKAIRINSGVDKSSHTSDQPDLAVWLSVYQSVEDDVIQSLLFIEQGSVSSTNRLHDFHVAVKIGTFVEDVDHPIGEPAEKITATKLEYLYRTSLTDTREGSV